MRLRCARVLLSLSAAILCGCENFSEHVDIGAWEPQPPAAAPELSPEHEPAVTTTTLVEGHGRLVEVGELVHLRYHRFVRSGDGSERREAAGEAWVWTGWEPEPDQGTWGDFGTPALRRALIGRNVGDTVDLRVGYDYAELVAPAYAITTPRSVHVGLNEAMESPQISVSRVLAGGRYAWSGPSRSEVEILDSCSAALATRTGTLRQWGYHFNMFGSAYQTDRHGLLRWSRLTATCAGSSGEFRRTIGPIYWRPEPWTAHGLMAWRGTYANVHGRERFPDDYDSATIGGKSLVPIHP
jgi:hypothetical protein